MHFPTVVLALISTVIAVTSIYNETEVCLVQFKRVYAVTHSETSRCGLVLSRALPCFDNQTEKIAFMNSWDNGSCSHLTALVPHDEPEVLDKHRRSRYLHQTRDVDPMEAPDEAIPFPKPVLDADALSKSTLDSRLPPLHMAAIYDYAAHKFRDTPFEQVAKQRAKELREAQALVPQHLLDTSPLNRVSFRGPVRGILIGLATVCAFVFL